MHAYRYPAHEQQVAALAREIGFAQVSVSHEVSPLIKLVGRGDTTVVDAYLSPILRRYVAQVTAEMGTAPTELSSPSPGGGGEKDTRLMFMMSSGGLTAAELFQGKDAILSGPAGGVVGMAETGRAAGFERLIGFDMGGTSTDVSHFDGEYERAFETEVAGVRMRAPMMLIHTVAAGGGSILHFDGARFRVGPDSAGANPGPACYRRGGPLTVTDANVMAGKLIPDFFPKIFGPAQNAADRRRRRAREIQTRARARPAARRRKSVADGFITIAVENMANAIKKISVQRGYDVTRYALNCFGGAGGQHACLVADALGMTQGADPSVLVAAFGLRHGPRRHSRDAPAGDRGAARGKVAGRAEKDRRHNSATQTRREVAAQGVPAHGHQGVRARACPLRRHRHGARRSAAGATGRHETRLRESAQVALRLHRPQQATRDRGGLGRGGRRRREIPREDSARVARQTALARPAHPILLRRKMARRRSCSPATSFVAASTVAGPAIIIEPHQTIVVEPGWRARITAKNHLVLDARMKLGRAHAVGTKADPVMLEIFNNLFMSIAEQMGVSLQNTAYSVNIKERLDFSCAVFSADGTLVANAPHMPVHLGSMDRSVETIIRDNKGRIAPGDVFAINAPYNGGTHLPDITVCTPVFDDARRKILFWVASRGHHADVGGISPGSMSPNATTIEQEGIYIDNFKLVDRGRFRERELQQLLTGGKYPARNPVQNVNDLKAQIAANEKGVQELRKMVAQFTLPVVTPT